MYYLKKRRLKIWKYIMDSCNVHTILKVASWRLFAPYAQGVKASVVFFQKGFGTENVWIYDARSNVKSITKRGRPPKLQVFRGL